MIQCRVIENNKTELLEIEVKGHAQEYNSVVNSNICAMTSLIITSLKKEVEFFGDYKSVSLDKGFFHLIVKTNSDNAVRVGLVVTQIQSLKMKYEYAFSIEYTLDGHTFYI